MEAQNIYALMWITVGVFFMPLIANRIKIPTAVAEILYGILIGKSVLNLVNSGQSLWIPSLADMGFMVLMFLAGMEIDFEKLKKRGLKSLTVPLIFLISIFGISTFFVIYLKWSPFFIFIFASIGVGLLIPVLKELNIDKKWIGEELFYLGIAGEFATLITFTFFEVYKMEGLSFGLLRIPLMIVIAYLFLRGIYIISWWFPEKVTTLLNPSDSRETGIRFSFALMFILVSFSIFFHIEFIIGAFIAGMVFSFTFRKQIHIEEKMNALGYGFFIPIFFINVGLKFDISTVFEYKTFILFGKIFIISTIVKIISSIFLIFKGISFSNAIASGFIFAAPLTLLVALGMIGLKLNIIDITTNNAIILLSMVTGMVYPVIFKLMYKEQQY